MYELGLARGFRDLVVYRKARTTAKRIFELTKRFPKNEAYSLTDQVRRSSRSVGAQITEAWAKRPYEKHFVSKLTDADAEQQETQHWIETAVDCEYLTCEEVTGVIKELEEIGKMLNTMIRKSDQFCGNRHEQIRETAAEYFVSPTNY